jgi:hypothetical protein
MTVTKFCGLVSTDGANIAIAWDRLGLRHFHLKLESSQKSQILITVSIAMLKYKKKFCDELIRSDIVNSKVEMSEVIRSI